MFAYDAFPKALQPFEPAMEKLLSKKLRNGRVRQASETPHRSKPSDWGFEATAAGPTLLSGSEYSQLVQSLPAGPPLSVNLLTCTAITLGSARYQPSSVSRHNSPTLYRGKDGVLRAGVIKAIFREPDTESRGPGRVAIRLQRYQNLEGSDVEKDPYSKHPLVGRSGYDLFRLYYPTFEADLDAVYLDGIVSQLCTCTIDDPIFTKTVLVTAVADKVSTCSSPPSTAHVTAFTELHQSSQRYQFTYGPSLQDNTTKRALHS